MEEAQNLKDNESEGTEHRSASPGEASNIGNGQSSPNEKDKESAYVLDTYVLFCHLNVHMHVCMYLQYLILSILSLLFTIFIRIIVRSR